MRSLLVSTSRLDTTRVLVSSRSHPDLFLVSSQSRPGLILVLSKSVHGLILVSQLNVEYSWSHPSLDPNLKISELSPNVVLDVRCCCHLTFRKLSLQSYTITWTGVPLSPLGQIVMLFGCRSVHRAALHRVLQEGGSPHHHLRGPTAGATHQGLCHCLCGRGCVLQGLQRHCERDQCEGHSSQHQVRFIDPESHGAWWL